MICAIGGSGADNNSTTNLFCYDPASPAAGWTQPAPLPATRTGLAAATGSDGLVYAIGGGATSSAQSVLNTVEAYAFDPNFQPGLLLDHIKKKGIYGALLGGIDRGAGGGVVIGRHFIPIPPHSPAMSAILDAATPYVGHAIENPQLEQFLQKLGPDAGGAGTAPSR